jgi:hypothetical protein
MEANFAVTGFGSTNNHVQLVKAALTIDLSL